MLHYPQGGFITIQKCRTIIKRAEHRGEKGKEKKKKSLIFQTSRTLAGLSSLSSPKVHVIVEEKSPTTLHHSRSILAQAQSPTQWHQIATLKLCKSRVSSYKQIWQINTRSDSWSHLAAPKYFPSKSPSWNHTNWASSTTLSNRLREI